MPHALLICKQHRKQYLYLTLSPFLEVRFDNICSILTFTEFEIKIIKKSGIIFFFGLSIICN